MGWELRHGGRWYLYRNRRVNGKPVKEYLAAQDAFGAVMAYDLDRINRRRATVRMLTRKEQQRFREQIDQMLAAVGGANTELRAVAEGVLCAAGFRRHNRGEWRMQRELKGLKALIKQLKDATAGLNPLVKYDPPAGDAEAVEVFAKARAGDAQAIERVRAMVRDRDWTGWLGDLGRQATRQLVWTASGGDRVWEAGITEKVAALLRELSGPNPSVLETLLARRVVNGWVAVHALELELTVRPPLDVRSREHLDRALTRAQKRMTEATRELARVRKLQAPTILAQLNVAAAQMVVNPPAASEATPKV